MVSFGTDWMNRIALDEWMKTAVLDSVEGLKDTDNAHDKVKGTLES